MPTTVSGRIIDAKVPIFFGEVAPPDDLGDAFPAVPVRALVDTGATSSLVAAALVTRLRLPSQGERLVRFGNDAEPIRRPRFACTFGFARNRTERDRTIAWPDILFVTAFDGTYRDFDVILGMDVLGAGDLSITRTGGVSFAFDPFA